MRRTFHNFSTEALFLFLMTWWFCTADVVAIKTVKTQKFEKFKNQVRTNTFCPDMRPQNRGSLFMTVVQAPEDFTHSLDTWTHTGDHSTPAWQQQSTISCCVLYLSHEDAVLLWRPGLVPHRQLQHVVTKIPSMNVRVDERLVPLWLAGLLHCFCPSFTFVTV